MSQLSSIVSLAQVKDLVEQVGTFQLKHFRSTEEITVEKGANELVSFVDETSEQLLFKGLSTIYPEAAFWGEEGGQRGEQDRTEAACPRFDEGLRPVHALRAQAVNIIQQD